MQSMSLSSMSFWEISTVLRRTKVFKNISLEQARQILTDHCDILTGEKIPLNQAINRILRKPVYAPHHMPPRAQSAVDGYALGEGPDRIGSSYNLVAELKLDSFPCFTLEYGQAVSVPTGGTLPEGTVAVVPGEKILAQQQQVKVLEKIKPGTNIKATGEDFSQGELLLPVGTKLDYAAIAVLEAFGFYEVETVRRPQTAVICLAENIISNEMILQDGQMRDSNGPMLSTLIGRDGGVISSVVYGGITGRDQMISELQNVMNQLDVVIFTGGTYENGENNMEVIMDALDARILYQGVEIQPGSHTGAALKGNCLLFWLSGNPSACAVNYHLFVYPAIKSLLGQQNEYKRIKACCVNGFAKKSNSRRMVRGRLWWSGKGWNVEVLPGQKPSMLRSLLYCNAFIDVPAGTPPIEAGQEVDVLVLPVGNVL
jgi:molybdopterin molybdotransferase